MPDPLGYILASIGTAYGQRRGRAVFKHNLAVIREDHAWLKDKSVLILGTGPSAAALSKATLDTYDFVVLLNFAIQFAPALKAFGIPPQAMGFFTQDKKRIIELSRWFSLSGIPKRRCIFMPDFPYSVAFMDLHRVPLTLLSGFKPYFKTYVKPSAYVTAGGWHFVNTPVPVNPIQLERDYTNFMDHSSQIPLVLPYSSVLSAIPLYSSFRPAKISLIGCDFTGPFFSLHPIAEVFGLLQSMLRNQGIELTNRSESLLHDHVQS